MSIVLRHYKKHFLLQQEQHEDLPKEARRFWEHLEASGLANNVCVATDKGAIVGFFRYEKRRRDGWGLGTWVSPKYRKKGLALRMWKSVLRREKIRYWNVTALSINGLKLAKSLRKNFPKYEWDIINFSTPAAFKKAMEKEDTSDTFQFDVEL